MIKIRKKSRKEKEELLWEECEEMRSEGYQGSDQIGLKIGQSG